MQNAGMAEIRFAGEGINFYGRVEQMSSEGLRVRLEPFPTGAGAMPGGMAEVLLVAKGLIYHAPVEVKANHDGRLTMRFCQPLQQVQRRTEKRKPCTMSVSFRTLNSAGCAGAWHEAEAMDISAGGMRLVLNGNVEAGRMVEILFLLNGDRVRQQNRLNGWEEEQQLRAAEAGARPVKATGRVVYCQATPQGSKVIGLAFRKISSFDQLRVYRFAETE